MMLLLASIVALVAGPLIYGAVKHRDGLQALLDGFVFVTITGLVLLYILPESFRLAGWTVFFFALAGLAGPYLLERLFHGHAKRTHATALILGLLGLCLHASIDGAALVDPVSHGSVEGILPAAVILHRLPIALTIWWLLRPQFGFKIASAYLALLGGMTVAGYFAGSVLLDAMSQTSIGWFEAFVAGSLLHVVFHQPHEEGPDCKCEDHEHPSDWYEGAGALAGLLLVVLLMGSTALVSAEGIQNEMLATFWRLALESAPALLIAYLLAGMMNAFLPKSSIRWMARGNAWTQSAKGMVVGLPFPICSCGVVPLYRTLIRQGAPVSGAVAFLVATPELGLDAVLISIPLLGGEMTVLRILAAALVAFLSGAVVSLFATSAAGRPSSIERSESPPPRFLERLWRGLQVGLGEVVDHTAPWIVLGLAVAAIAEPFLESGWLATIPSGIDVLIFALLGLPMYVCASGATPLVAVLLLGGISPGAALAFLLTGPATNVTTFGLLGQLHSRRFAAAFSLTIILLAVGVGLVVNSFFPTAGAVPLKGVLEESPSAFQLFSLVALTLIYLFSLLRRGGRRFVGELLFQDEHSIHAHPHS